MAAEDASCFDATFRALTGNDPFPWQRGLYERMIQGNVPSSCDIPTGLGKTAVVAVWLIALAKCPEKMPRRLVYVVNRRTVVDQSTSETERIRRRLNGEGDLSDEDRTVLGELRCLLAELCAADHEEVLAISTLRGQFADNRQWSADPARPAVIVGTVDMIGSRLLFSGYRVGFKAKPLHAGLLGQDVLLVHDEAHLEEPFQRLVDEIEREQRNGRTPDRSPVRIIALSATRRRDNGSAAPEAENLFRLTPAEMSPPPTLPSEPTEPIHHVWRRLKAKKAARFHSAGSEKGAVAKQIAALAAAYKDKHSAVLIFVQTLDDVATVEKELGKTKRHVVLLTGTMRGKERDALVETPVFKRFLKGAKPAETVYLLCTSAGEVGIDISADHLVCDLTPIDSMVQRFGRVNRYGDGDALIDVVHPTPFDEKDKLSPAREKTLMLLHELPPLPDREGEPGVRRWDASPKALGDLRGRTDLPCKIEDAFTPTPRILDATDILFDAWALTTIRDKMPGRPAVEPYLHGISDWQRPETQVAWRKEVDVITGELAEDHRPEDLLEDYPLKPHELLRDRSDRVLGELAAIRKRTDADTAIWIVEERGQVEVTTLGKLLDADKKVAVNRIAYCTVLFSPSVGGLSDKGTLVGRLRFDPGHTSGYDIADEWFEDTQRTICRRVRIRNDDPKHFPPKGMRLIRTIDTDSGADEDESKEPTGRRYWHWYSRPLAADDDLTKTFTDPIRWDHHTEDVIRNVTRIAKALTLPSDLEQALNIAAKLHDSGKKREVWQRSIGNPNPTDWHAKSGRDPVNGKLWKPHDICPDYRHEFGSLLDVQAEPEFEKLDQEMKDLVLHLIAAGHGRARPHFPMNEAFDPTPGRTQADADRLASEVPRRFARLQGRYGRWGLAYLESLLRAADWGASAEPSEFVTETTEVSR